MTVRLLLFFLPKTILSGNKMDFLHFTLPTDPDMDNINEYFNDTNGCLINSHTLLLQNKIVIAQQIKIAIVLHGKMQVIDNMI